MDTRVSDNLLLVTVTKVEATALLSAWEAVSGTPSKPRVINGKIYHSLGSVGGLNHFMVQSEMGTIGLGAALLTVHEGIEALSPTAVIMVGIAFGVDPSTQKIGDILVSQRIQSYEPQRLGRGLPATPKVVPRGDRASASPRLLNWFHAGDLTWKGAPVRFGLILSGEKLVDNQDFRNQLIRLEPEAIGGEMEGAGLYAAAQNSNTEWILVKAISDWADGTRDTDKIAIQENAARNAAQFVLHVLSQVPLGPQAPQQQQVKTKAQTLQERVLDAAIAKRIPVNRATKLLAMIRRVKSQGLRGTLEKDHSYSLAPETVRSGPFVLTLPVDKRRVVQSAEVVLKVESPDFDPPSQEALLTVPPDGDSPLCEVALTPLKPGNLVVIVTVLRDGHLLGARSLKTTAQGETESKEMSLVSIDFVLIVDPSQGKRGDALQKWLEKHGVAEPPPLIRYLTWLLDRENWRMYWKPITLALLVMVAGVAITFAPKIINREPTPSVSVPPIVSPPTTLSDDQMRAAIMEALHDNNVPAALNLLHDIKEAGVKDEECRHVFDFCIKNGRFEYLDALKKQCPEVR
jgi:nucleoside phosphorylase